MRFNLYVGIDYSGAETSTASLRELQVYSATKCVEPSRVPIPNPTSKNRRNWTRKEVAEWLVARVRDGHSLIAGIDHAFSFPAAYLDQHALPGWAQFLCDFCKYWPTHQDGRTVESLRNDNQRTGDPKWMRLTDKWTSSAKSVFRLDGQGQVGKSSHAGIPWLAVIREEVGDRVHFWPFDGWDVPTGKSVIAEVYPSIFKKRYPKVCEVEDEHDAYSVARWLSEADELGRLERYFNPPLTDEEKGVAEREGWILGIS